MPAGWGMEEYIEGGLKPPGLRGSRDVGGGGLCEVGGAWSSAGAEVVVLPLLPLPVLPRRWLRSFSSRRHLARRLLNQTWEQRKENNYNMRRWKAN